MDGIGSLGIVRFDPLCNLFRFWSWLAYCFANLLTLGFDSVVDSGDPTLFEEFAYNLLHIGRAHATFDTVFDSMDTWARYNRMGV